VSAFVKRHPVVVTIPVLFIAWWAVARFGLVGPSLLASPSEVLAVIARAFHPGPANEAVFHHAAGSFGRALAGWSLSIALGLVIGLLLGLSPAAYRAFEPVLEFCRAIPPVMAFPPLLVAFSFGAPAYVWAIAVGCLPIAVLTIARGVQSLDRARRELLVVHEVPRGVRLVASAVEILPSTFLAARVIFSYSIVVALVTEMIFSPRSGFALGSLAKDAEISFDTPTFYACVVVVAVYGYVINALLRRIEWWLGGNESKKSPLGS
jgi:sulfonate transport system permease protein